MGYIQGEDLALCACCGGIIIEINGENYRFENINKFNIDLEKETSPLKVDLNWHISESPAMCNEIIIEEMKKIKS